LPTEVGAALVKNVSTEIERLGYIDLATVPPAVLVEAQNKLGIRNVWLQMEPSFEGWATKTGNTTKLLIGDVEYEVRMPLMFSGMYTH
jgi:hypothetical protein